MELKVVSLNLAGYSNWDTRCKNIVSFIDANKPDIVALQEVHFDASKSSHNQADDVNRLLSARYEYTNSCISRFYISRDNKVRREGLSVLSNFPIKEAEVLALTKEPDDRHFRIIQDCKIRASDAYEFQLMNVHLSNNKYSDTQLEELLGYINARDKKTIIVGDFNIFDLTALKGLYQPEYKASVEFKQYVSFPVEGVTLDYMLLPKEYFFQKIDSESGLSDHSAITYFIQI